MHLARNLDHPGARSEGSAHLAGQQEMAEVVDSEVDLISILRRAFHRTYACVVHEYIERFAACHEPGCGFSTGTEG